MIKMLPHIKTTLQLRSDYVSPAVLTSLSKTTFSRSTKPRRQKRGSTKVLADKSARRDVADATKKKANQKKLEKR